MNNNYADMLAKLKARGLTVTGKCAQRRIKQAHTPAQAKAKCISIIDANLRHLQTPDGSVEHTPLYTQQADGSYTVAAKYGNSFLKHWLPVQQPDGSFDLDSYLKCSAQDLEQTLELLKEFIEAGYADEAIAKVQEQNAEAGRKRREQMQAKKRVKVHG